MRRENKITANKQENNWAVMKDIVSMYVYVYVGSECTHTNTHEEKYKYAYGIICSLFTQQTTQVPSFPEVSVNRGYKHFCLSYIICMWGLKSTFFKEVAQRLRMCFWLKTMTVGNLLIFYWNSNICICSYPTPTMH